MTVWYTKGQLALQESLSSYLAQEEPERVRGSPKNSILRSKLICSTKNYLQNCWHSANELNLNGTLKRNANLTLKSDSWFRESHAINSTAKNSLNSPASSQQ